MGLFNDTVTLYQKQKDGSTKRTVVQGVQWSSVVEKNLSTGKLILTKTISATFPIETLDQVDLSSFTEEDAIFFGEVQEEIGEGNRLSKLMDTYKGGIIRSINDNTNRDHLKNIKVVVY